DGCAEGRADPPYPPGTAALACLPAGLDGTRLALDRWQRRVGHYHADRLCQSGGARAPATSQPDPPPPVGVLLARFAFGGSDALAQAEALMCGAPARPPLDRLELAVSAFQATGDERWRAAACDAARALVERRAATGLWFPEAGIAERHNLSAVSGLAAIAHA